MLAIDLQTLVTLARQHDGVIEFMPQVGDFVATDEPLFVLYGGAAAITDEALRATVAFGPERTLEQDPMFAFRILVDIGLKALSPAINDPTTAVLAIDQVQRLLRVLGRRHLRPDVMLDTAGRPRVIYTARRTGRTSFTSHAPRFAPAERTICRSRDVCAQCSRISSRSWRRPVMAR